MFGKFIFAKVLATKFWLMAEKFSLMKLACLTEFTNKNFHYTIPILFEVNSFSVHSFYTWKLSRFIFSS